MRASADRPWKCRSTGSARWIGRYSASALQTARVCCSTWSVVLGTGQSGFGNPSSSAFAAGGGVCSTCAVARFIRVTQALGSLSNISPVRFKLLIDCIGVLLSAASISDENSSGVLGLTKTSDGARGTSLSLSEPISSCVLSSLTTRSGLNRYKPVRRQLLRMVLDVKVALRIDWIVAIKSALLMSRAPVLDAWSSLRP